MATILIIGTGRAAFHFGHAVRMVGNDLVGVVGRDRTKSADLANELGCRAYALGDTLPAADVVLIAVSDDAIADVAAHIPISDTVVIHTSGASSMDKLAPHADRGVVWPIMTLSPGTPMDFRSIPLVIDANTERAKATVKELAAGMSDHVTALDHHARELVHAAAAISTNFPLYLLGAAQRLLATNGIDPSLLMPSFIAMAAKAKALGPEAALTGPARRGDIGTVHHHLDRLTQEPELRAAYALLSSMILRAYGHPDHER